MFTNSSLLRQASKRTASGTLIGVKQTNDQGLQWIRDLTDDHEFLAPHEICQNAIGLCFGLVTKRLISISFANLYHRSQKQEWLNLLTRERRNLKPNINSVEKCFMYNRLIAECTKNPTEFARHLTDLHNELKSRMSSTITSFSTAKNLYSKLQAYQISQSQQRLFHMTHDATQESYTLLGLQRATSKLYSQFINSSELTTNAIQTDERQAFRELLQHSFIIVCQPSTPECAAATKYEKCGSTYTVKVNSRILCLLSVDKIKSDWTFAPTDVTLYPLKRQVGEQGARQPVLEWKTKQIFDENGVASLFYYVELQSIQLTKSDARNSHPLVNSKLCQLEFQLKITMNKLNIEENLTILSQPFGVCSHAQYFPEYVAKVIVYEIEQIPQHAGLVIQPDVMTDFICRYHTRIAGVKPKHHTREFIYQQLQTVYGMKKTDMSISSIEIYEEILAKLISQIDSFVDHPYLAMMYNDNLFLGICNSAVDHQIRGTPEQMHILLRFDTLAEHQSNQPAAVRYIVHNGDLIKATLHPKAFVDDMCRMICESNSEKAKVSRILSDIPTRSFHDFTLYFDKELYRLGSVSPPTKEAYKPLIPVLWFTMRSTIDGQSISSSTASPSSDNEVTASCIASRSPTSISSSNVTTTTNSVTNLNEKVLFDGDKLIHYLVEKLPEILVKRDDCPTLSRPTITSSAHSSDSIDDIMKQQKLLLSNLLHDYFQGIAQVQVSTQVKDEKNDTKSYTSYCSTSTNT